MSTPVSARTSAVLPWSMWPAVPTRQRGARARRPPRARPRRRRASAGRAGAGPSWMRPITGGSAARSRGGELLGVARRARRPGPGSSSSGSAPPPTFAVASTTSPADRRREPLGARARVLERASAAPGSPAARARARGRARASRRSAARQSLSIRTARASGWRRQAAIASRVPTITPGLRPAEQLVAAEAHDRRARAHRPPHLRLAGQHLERRRGTPEPTSSMTGRPSPQSCLDLDLLGEAERRGSSTGARAGSRRRRRRRSRAAACGSSCRPRRAARPPARSPRGCGTSRRSRRAARARRRPRARARRPRAAPRRRSC